MNLSDCPKEIIDEILSNVHSDGPPTLQGLQLALTCKALYEFLQPTIVGVQIKQLANATEKRALLFYKLNPSSYSPAGIIEDFKSKDFDSNWRSTARDPMDKESAQTLIRGLFHSSKDPDFDLGIVYQLSRSDQELCCLAEQTWCLHSLFSRSRRCRRVQFFFLSPLRRRANASSRAFLTLMDACAQQGMEMTITDSASPGMGGIQGIETNEPLFIHKFTALPEPSTQIPRKKSFLRQCLLWPSKKKPAKLETTIDEPDKQISVDCGPNRWNDSVEVRSGFPSLPGDMGTRLNGFSESRLSMLILSNKAPFVPLLFPRLYDLAIHSSASLTRLHISNCRLVAYDWHAVLCSWRFPQLSHFSVRDSLVPFPVLTSFLRAHSTLTAVTLLVHEIIGTAPSLAEEDFLPNVCQLVATASLLIPILSPASDGSTRPNIKGRFLSSLETLTISQEHNFAQDSLAAVRFDKISTVLRLVASCKTGSSLLPRLHTLAIRTMYPAHQCFQGWLRTVVTTAAPQATEATATTSNSSHQSVNITAPETLPNFPLESISQLQISAHNPGWEPANIVPTMRVDPNLVVDFISCTFGGSADLRTVVMSDIFSGCSGLTLDPQTEKVVWRERDEFPLAIGRLWERCEGLEEVRLPGMARLGVDELWRRPIASSSAEA